jgi:hypothetical protein
MTARLAPLLAADLSAPRPLVSISLPTPLIHSPCRRSCLVEKGCSHTLSDRVFVSREHSDLRRRSMRLARRKRASRRCWHGESARAAAP